MISNFERDIVREHWEWVDEFLNCMKIKYDHDRIETDLFHLIRYIYMTAFEHGIKHGRELEKGSES